MRTQVYPRLPGAGALWLFAITILSLTGLCIPSAAGKSNLGAVTRFSPDEGQPLFPAGNLNVFKQYVLAIDESERIGKQVSIDLLFTSLDFGGEVAGGVKAAFGLEVGMCFGGNADFDLAFQPAITVPDRYPSEFPIRLVVDEGLRPDSHFTTTFPPLGKAYADLIFDIDVYLKTTACVFGCFEPPQANFRFDTCDPRIPSIGGYRMFKDSVRCDPALDAEAYCSVELASFNRDNDNAFRMLNVTAQNRFEFLAKPYLEYAPSSGVGFTKPFGTDPAKDTLTVSGVHRLSDGKQVKVKSTGSLPGGLSSAQTYFVNKLAATSATGIQFQLATRAGGSGVNITDAGTGTHEISIVETSKPDSPSIGKYGTISISAPTVGTDSRVAAINGAEKSFTVDPFNDRVVVLTPPGYRNGDRVRISSAGKLPQGLARGCVYYVTNAAAAGLSIQLATTLGGPPADIQDAGTGTHRIARNAEFSTAGGLRSTGAEDMMSIGIDAAALVSDILLPPTFPSLSDSGSLGPISYDYTLASLELGPAIQLQTDFEMTWDLVVTEITFREPGTFNGRPVIIEGKQVTQFTTSFPGRTLHLTNQGPYALPSIVLLNTEPVQVTITYRLAPKLKTKVSAPFLGRVKYAALGAGASIDRIGELRFGPLIKGEHVFKAGEFNVYNGNPSPIASAGARSEYGLAQDIARYDLVLVDTATQSLPATGCGLVVVYRAGGTLWVRIFDIVGERVVDRPAAEVLSGPTFAALQDQLDPWPLSDLTDSESENVLKSATALAGYAPGVITFALQAAGPPSFSWSPYPSDSGTTYSWIANIGTAQNPATRWVELYTALKTSYPGEIDPEPFGGSGADATIAASPYPTLYDTRKIASLKVDQNYRLDVQSGSGSVVQAGLKVLGGVVENNGSINLRGRTSGSLPSYLWLAKPDVMLTGGGTLNLADGAEFGGNNNSEPFTFTNYNTITGTGIAMSRYFIGSGSTITNLGRISSSGGNSGTLYTSARQFINHGGLEAQSNTSLSLGAGHLDNKAGARISAYDPGATVYLAAGEVEHAGLVEADNGATVFIAPYNQETAVWYAGQAFNDWQPGTTPPADNGAFLATRAGSIIDLRAINLKGGFMGATGGGRLKVADSNFDGTVFQIGTFDPESVDPQSGTLVVSGNGLEFRGVYLTNYGTLLVIGGADFADTMGFGNNGTVEVWNGATLHIREITGRTADPAAPESARRQPGTANATGETLVGGTWDISGTLLIDGASFTSLGANAARARTTSGSTLFGPDPDLTVAVAEDLTRVLSLGKPAHVILRGNQWSFPALDTLNENGGVLELQEFASFPGAAGGSTSGDFLNRGDLIIGQSSTMSVGGSFVQAGAKSMTRISFLGGLESAIRDYRIIGGTVVVDADAAFFSRTGNSFMSGTRIRVESPLVDTNETNPFTGEPVFVQEKVVIDLGSGLAITTIAAGVDITLHGGAVRFPALTENLVENNGRFTISGDGIDNSPNLDIGLDSFGAFTNRGELNILGTTTRMFAGSYFQDGGGSLTRIGSGALLSVSTLDINDGELVVEISARPGEGQFGQLQASEANFNNRLIIDFTGEVAESKPDIGDTWPVMRASSSSRITGDSVTYRFNGGAVPGDWLPAGSHLEVVRLNPKTAVQDGGILSGLGIRVVPDGGFIDYDAWAQAQGLDRSPAAFLSDPMRDANNDGIANVYEFLFGPNGGSGMFPGRQGQRLVSAEGRTYIELSYDRPTGTGAAYSPSYSRDLKYWSPAAMVITDIFDLGGGSNLQRVTLASTFPIPDGQVFFRVNGLLNVIDHGLFAEKPIVYFGGAPLNNLTPEDLIQDNVTPKYLVVPGRELFFKTTGRTEGSVYALVLADDTRINIYQDFSALGAAAVHAGLLQDGESGVLKVVFIEPPPAPQFGNPSDHRWTENGVTAYPFTFPRRSNEPYSFRMEKVSGDPGY